MSVDFRCDCSVMSRPFQSVLLRENLDFTSRVNGNNPSPAQVSAFPKTHQLW